MHSPKFKAKAKVLGGTVNRSTFLASWKKKVRTDLRRQIVPDPVEFLDFHVNRDAACAALAQAIKTGAYAPSPVTRLTTEKSKGLCRLIVLPSIRDVLILQVLADALWAVLKKDPPSANAHYAPQDSFFSKMTKGLEDDYGPIASWLRFQKQILGFADTKSFIVVTDIANYYDWVRYTGLRAVLSDRVGTKEVVLDLLLHILRSMIWQPDYMANYEIGLPQCDFDAPRMLAHTFLFEIDELLRDYPAIDFARYADDIDIGTDSYSDAKLVLRDLDLTLQSRHLRLNSGKTLILNQAQALDHFCVEENKLLDQFETHVAKLARQGLKSRVPRKLLPALTLRWFNAKRYERGNGQKVLKRLINYSRNHRIAIDGEFFVYAFMMWPGVRDPLL